VSFKEDERTKKKRYEGAFNSARPDCSLVEGLLALSINWFGRPLFSFCCPFFVYLGVVPLLSEVITV